MVAVTSTILRAQASRAARICADPRRGRTRVMCDGLACTNACPAGALKTATPATMRIGWVRFRADSCFASQGLDPGCDYCFDRCPMKGQAITYRRGRGPDIDADHCTGCGVCVFFCPAHPKALEVTPEVLGKS